MCAKRVAGKTDAIPRDIDLFWSKVKIAGPDECWEWTAAKFKAGYGAIRCGDRTVYAHRLSYRIENGVWPNICRHKCDNRGCVNPAHLCTGTQKDNMRDVAERGGYRKFSPRQVREIRDSKATSPVLGRQLGCCQTLIRQIRGGKIYKDVE